jgi:hypothetical protein
MKERALNSKNKSVCYFLGVINALKYTCKHQKKKRAKLTQLHRHCLFLDRQQQSFWLPISESIAA